MLRWSFDAVGNRPVDLTDSIEHRLGCHLGIEVAGTAVSRRELWSTALTCSLGCRQHGHACRACAACAVDCSLSTHVAWTEDGQWNGNWPIMVFRQSEGALRRSGRSSRVVFRGVTHRCLRGLSIGNRWATRRELAKVWPVRFGGWYSKRFAAPSGLAQHHYR